MLIIVDVLLLLWNQFIYQLREAHIHIEGEREMPNLQDK